MYFRFLFISLIDHIFKVMNFIDQHYIELLGWPVVIFFLFKFWCIDFSVFCFLAQNYGSLDSIESAKVILEKDRKVYDAAIVSEIDRTMKKHADSLLHALEGVSARLSQLESRTHHIENSIDDLKVSVGNNHGSTDGKMRQLENILRDVCLSCPLGLT